MCVKFHIKIRSICLENSQKALGCTCCRVVEAILARISIFYLNLLCRYRVLTSKNLLTRGGIYVSVNNPLIKRDFFCIKLVVHLFHTAAAYS